MAMADKVNPHVRNRFLQGHQNRDDLLRERLYLIEGGFVGYFRNECGSLLHEAVFGFGLCESVSEGKLRPKDIEFLETVTKAWRGQTQLVPPDHLIVRDTHFETQLAVVALLQGGNDGKKRRSGGYREAVVLKHGFAVPGNAGRVERKEGSLQRFSDDGYACYRFGKVQLCGEKNYGVRFHKKIFKRTGAVKYRCAFPRAGKALPGNGGKAVESAIGRGAKALKRCA